MFKDYSDAVVKEYHEKAGLNMLSQNLIQFTPARLKRECLAVLKTRFKREDEKTLSDFFGFAEGIRSYHNLIERCDIDKFRPVINFVEKRSKDTADENIELLAWLIDFKDRPFDPKGPYGGAGTILKLNENQDKIIDTDLIGTGNPFPSENSGAPGIIGKEIKLNPEKNNIVNSERRSSNRKVLKTAGFLTLIAGMMGYLTLSWPVSPTVSGNSDSCMYWKDDHYERISCAKNVQVSKVIDLNTELLNNFKKITQPDTITYNSLGNVWYTKQSGEVEFYTAMGYHPVLIEVQLKPITRYIIDKYILSDKQVNDSAINSHMYVNMPLSQSGGPRATPSSVKPKTYGLYGQCLAITKKKTRCLRKANIGGYCWQHSK